MVSISNHDRQPRSVHYPPVDAVADAQVAARPEGVPAGARGARVATYLRPTASSTARDRSISNHPAPPSRPAPTPPTPSTPPKAATSLSPPNSPHPSSTAEDKMGKITEGLSRRLSRVSRRLSRLSRLGEAEINDQEDDSTPILATPTENVQPEDDGVREENEGHYGGLREEEKSYVQDHKEEEEIVDPNSGLGNYDFGEDYTDRLDGFMPQWYYDKYYGAKDHYHNPTHILDVTYHSGPAENLRGKNYDLALENVISWRDVYSQEPQLFQHNRTTPPGPTNDVIADLEAKIPSDQNVPDSDCSDRFSEPDLDDALNSMNPPIYAGHFVGDLNDDERPPELSSGYTEQRPRRVHRRDLIIMHHNQVANEIRRRAATKAEYERQEARKRIATKPLSRKAPEIPDKPYLYRGTPEWDEMEKARSWLLLNAKAKAMGHPEPPNKPVPRFPKPPRGYVETVYVPADFRRHVHKAFGTFKESGLQDEDESSSEEEGGFAAWSRARQSTSSSPKLVRSKPASRSSNSSHNSEDDQTQENSASAPPVPPIKDKRSYSALGKKDLGREDLGEGKLNEGHPGHLKRDRSFVDMVGSAFKRSSRLPQSKTMPNFGARNKGSISKPSNGLTNVLGPRPIVTSADRPQTPENPEVEEDIYGVSPETRQAIAAYARNQRIAAQASRVSTDSHKSGLQNPDGESSGSSEEIEFWDKDGNPLYYDRATNRTHNISPSGRIIPLPGSTRSSYKFTPILGPKIVDPKDVPWDALIFEADGVTRAEHPLYPTASNRSDRSSRTFGSSSLGSTASSRHNTRDRPPLAPSYDTQTSMATREITWNAESPRPSPVLPNTGYDRSSRNRAPNTSSSGARGRTSNAPSSFASGNGSYSARHTPVSRQFDTPDFSGGRPSIASSHEDAGRHARSSLPSPSRETTRPRTSRPSAPLSRVASPRSPDRDISNEVPNNVNRRYSGIPRPSATTAQQSGNKASTQYDFFGQVNAELVYDKIEGRDARKKKTKSPRPRPEDIATIISKELEAVGAPARSREEIMRHFGDAASIVSSKTLPNLNLGGRLRRYIPNQHSPSESPRRSSHDYTRLADEASSSVSRNAGSRPPRGPPTSASVPNLSGRPSHQEDRSRRPYMPSQLGHEQPATEYAELSHNGETSFGRMGSPDTISGPGPSLDRSGSIRAHRSLATPAPSDVPEPDLKLNPAYASIPLPPEYSVRRDSSGRDRARPFPSHRPTSSFGGGGFSISNTADRHPAGGRQSFSPGARSSQQYASLGSHLASIPSEGDLATAFEAGRSDGRSLMGSYSIGPSVGRSGAGISYNSGHYNVGPSTSGPSNVGHSKTGSTHGTSTSSDTGRGNMSSSSAGPSVGRSGAGMSHNVGHYNTRSPDVGTSNVGHLPTHRSTHRTSTSSNADRTNMGSSSLGSSVGRSGADMSHNTGYYNAGLSTYGPSKVGPSNVGLSTHRTSTPEEIGYSMASTSTTRYVDHSNDVGPTNMSYASVGASVGRSGADMSRNIGHYNAGPSNVGPSSRSTFDEIVSSMASPSTIRRVDHSNTGRMHTGSSSVGPSIGRSAGVSPTTGHYNVGHWTNGRSAHEASASGDIGWTVESPPRTDRSVSPSITGPSNVRTSTASVYENRFSRGPAKSDPLGGVSHVQPDGYGVTVFSRGSPVSSPPAVSPSTGNVGSSAAAGSAPIGSFTPGSSRVYIFGHGHSGDSSDDDDDVTWGPDGANSWDSLRNSIVANMAEGMKKQHEEEEAKKEE